jgi:hypothetical protein
MHGAFFPRLPRLEFREFRVLSPVLNYERDAA